ncbi:MAG: tRNA modification GTPase [Planctomycetota bacterium]|jgi:tRNA modification GTPase
MPEAGIRAPFMLYPLDDSIVAIASPLGGAARGILRLSGPDALACVERLFQADDRRAPSSVTAASVICGSLQLGESTRLPCDLYLWPGPRSYTGQPMAELHTLGCTPLLEAALEALCEAGARLAEPGEFTLRAFLTGRIDLTRAEAVLGVIDAAGDRQFDVALAQLAGGLAQPITQLRDDLLDLLAQLEAGFDFADEDVEFVTHDELSRRLADAAQFVESLAHKMETRHHAGELARAVLTGWPNVGKSSLFNALSGTGALVSEQPGTTRDYLTAELDLHGAKVLLIDTAGFDPEPAASGDSLGEAAQAASRRETGSAHVRILCLDSTRPLNAWERAQLATDAANRLVVLTKADLPRRTDFAGRAIRTSALSGEGIEAVRDRLGDEVIAGQTPATAVVPSTAGRCRRSLRLAADGLDRAARLAGDDGGEELVAAEVRFALEELGKVVGAVYTDDLLDRIFSRFCIGK